MTLEQIVEEVKKLTPNELHLLDRVIYKLKLLQMQENDTLVDRLAQRGTVK